jgi:hypothetical protein
LKDDKNPKGTLIKVAAIGAVVAAIVLLVRKFTKRS